MNIMIEAPKFFLYSKKQHDENTEIHQKAGKEYKCGYVVVNGVRKLYTQISEKPTSERYTDSQVVLEVLTLQEAKYKPYKVL